MQTVRQDCATRDNGAAVGSPSREYILAGGTRLAKIASGSTVYYHRDQVSTRVTTDSNGNVLSQQGHYPFGENWYQSGPTPNSQPPSPLTTDQQFTTYARDTESGNDYALAREFVSRLGRFSALDPLPGNTANPQSLNRYSYALNDPIDLLDPEGEYACVTGCGGNLAMGIGGWDGFGDLGMLSLAATPTGIESVAVQCQGGEGCVNGWTEIEKVDYDYSYLLDYLRQNPPDVGPPDVGPPSFPPLGPGLTSGLAAGLLPPNLAKCVKQDFGVTLTAFTASVPGQFGSFTGAMSGVYQGPNKPLASGPSQITIFNNNSLDEETVTSNFISGGGTLRAGYDAAGYTNPNQPFMNYTASNLSPGMNPTGAGTTAPYMVDNQIWELGNSLGDITNTPMPAGYSEFGRLLLECALGTGPH